MEKSAKKSKKSRKEEQKVEGDEDKSDYDDEVSILEITKDMEKVFGEIRKKIKSAKHIKSKDKLYHKVRSIYVLLSSNSRKFFERKIKRFSEQSITSNDDLSTLAEIINEMIDKFIDEYPKFTSIIKGREECIETGKEIAARFNVENLNLVQEEKKKWKEEDRFYRKSDEYINQIDKNDLDINKCNTKLSRQRELEDKLNSILKEGEAKNNNMKRVLNSIKKELKELKKSNKQIDFNKVICDNLKKYQIDYTISQVLYGASEEMKDMDFNLKDEDHEISKIVKDKFAIVYQEKNCDYCDKHDS